MLRWQRDGVLEGFGAGAFGLDHSERVPDLATPANLSHQTQPKGAKRLAACREDESQHDFLIHS